MLRIYIKRVQAFIQALLSTAIFPQRFSFFTVCLFQWLQGWPHGRHQKENFLRFRPVDYWKIYFSQIFPRNFHNFVKISVLMTFISISISLKTSIIFEKIKVEKIQISLIKVYELHRSIHLLCNHFFRDS